jgi:hypothetical protein
MFPVAINLTLVSSTLFSLLVFIGPFALIPVPVGVPDIRACPQTSDMRARIYTLTSNTNACPNASNIEACPNAGEDYPSTCAVIQSVCIAGDTEAKHNGKGYSKKGYTSNPLHFISFLPVIIGISLSIEHYNKLTYRQPKVTQGFGQRWFSR